MQLQLSRIEKLHFWCTLLSDIPHVPARILHMSRGTLGTNYRPLLSYSMQRNGWLFIESLPYNSNGNEKGASVQSPSKVPCADEGLVSQTEERLQGDVSMCDTLSKGKDPRIHAPPICGRWTQAQPTYLMSNKSSATNLCQLDLYKPTI